MVLAMAKAYTMVPPEQRADTPIFVHNLAAAGAVDIRGPGTVCLRSSGDIEATG